MKRLFVCIFIFLSFFKPIGIFAKDMRKNVIEAERIGAELLKKAIQEKEIAKKEAKESSKRILSDKNALTEAIEKIRSQNNAIKTANKKLKEKNKKLAKLENELAEKLSGMNAVVKELKGLMQIAAKDLDRLLSQSISSAFYPERCEKIKELLDNSKFAQMDDIKTMVDIFFGEIEKSGEVSIKNGLIVKRAGEETTAKVLTLGNFTAAYQIEEGGKKETGFLIFSGKSRRLFALSKLPSWTVSRKLRDYMSGKSVDVPIDISRGVALRQLAHEISFKRQILDGGPIVWPILGIGIIALIIIIERFIFLHRISINTDKMMTKVNLLATEGKWDECIKICKKQKERPVPKVLLAGIRAKDKSREEMENILQEAILREIPRIEKMLATLGVLAAVAPLLGLLGTVTGMINTFHVLTFYGASDPKAMSGGISEALTTTMLGLGVAIPIMLFHTFLSRNAEKIISQMEEKAVSLANAVFKF